MSISAWKWESASCQSDLVERHWLEARRKYVLPVVQRASPVGHGHRRSADGNRRSGNAERRGSDPQSETPMGIGDRPMDFAEAPMAFVEAPTSFGKAPSPACEYVVNLELAGRAFPGSSTCHCVAPEIGEKCRRAPFFRAALASPPACPEESAERRPFPCTTSPRYGSCWATGA